MEPEFSLPRLQELAIFPVLRQIYQVDAFNGVFFEA